MRFQLLYYNPHLTEEYFIACLINGLKEELIPFLDIAHPSTLEEAYEQAQLHEKALLALNHKNRYTPKVPNGAYQSSLQNKGSSGFAVNRATENMKPNYTPSPRNSATQYPANKQLIEQRRAAGLCFRCGDKYHPGHSCANKSLNTLQAMEEVLEIYDEECLQDESNERGGTEGDMGAVPELEEAQEIGVSVHALSGKRPQDTIKIRGEAKNRTLTILIDTGSTHSFIDLQVAKEVRTKLETAPPLVVTVANGHKVLSKLRCPDFAWTMQGQVFEADLRVIRLEGSSIVLGIDWLKSYGKVVFDFMANSVTIMKEGQHLELKGIEEGAKLKLITAAQWNLEWETGECYLLSHQVAAGGSTEEAGLHHCIQQLLDE